ncbi:DUF4276 family protein [Campylobacter portucalensis]|uniref:DUF4276 family protein n=1 Tax=Campylobacter portucalensis TaxID=2608384 RepID=UPI0018A6B525|nr:DUF4276 family protein [Campylobacter portucalensis]
MIRIFVICEGRTEERFIKDIFTPYFNPQKFYIQPLMIPISKTSKGGALNYQIVKNFICDKLKKDENAYLTTMFDYYAIDNNFPGTNNNISDIYKKVSFLENKFYKDILSTVATARDKFIPYFQLHEFESLLFSDIDKIILGDPSWNNNDKKLLDVLDKLKDEMNEEFSNNPKCINNSLQTSPSRRLKVIFISPKYKNVFHGNKIA